MLKKRRRERRRTRTKRKCECTYPEEDSAKEDSVKRRRR